MPRYEVKRNRYEGWNVIDNETGRPVAWVFDQTVERRKPDVDRRRAGSMRQFFKADVSIG